MPDIQQQNNNAYWKQCFEQKYKKSSLRSLDLVVDIASPRVKNVFNGWHAGSAMRPNWIELSKSPLCWSWKEQYEGKRRGDALVRQGWRKTRASTTSAKEQADAWQIFFPFYYQQDHVHNIIGFLVLQGLKQHINAAYCRFDLDFFFCSWCLPTALSLYFG